MATTKTGTATTTTGEILSSVFLPIVKPHLLDQFRRVWGSTLVLTDDVRDKKCPGKLKIEFFTRDGEMFALAPKSYYAYCRATNNKKEGKKGIPKWFDLKKKDFEETIYNENPIDHCVEVRSLRLNKQKQMTRTTTIKTGLSGIHVKLRVKPDKITCEPLKINGEFV